MDSYFMDQIIGSYDECFFGSEDCGGDWYNGFDYDPNFYHYRVRFKIAHETDKAYLFEVKEGQFWCPKSLLRNIRRDGDIIRALLWDGFERKLIQPQPKVIDEFDIEPEPPKKQTAEERFKEQYMGEFIPEPVPKKKKKQKGDVVYDAEWARNEGLI